MTTVRAPQRADRKREEPKAPALRVVDTSEVADARRNPTRVFGVLTLGLLFAALFGVVVFQVFLVQTQFKLDEVNRKVAAEEERAQDLGLRAAELEAPERIVRDARDRLGMISPGEPAYLDPKPDDAARAAFDPAKEKAPTTTVAPATTPTTAWQPAATTPTTAWKPAATTPTTAWKPAATTPTTVTPTTKAPVTTTTRPATTTTTAPRPSTTTSGAR